MKRICYFHVYLSDDLGTWSHITLELMKALEDSKLLRQLDEIRVTCVSKKDGREELFLKLLSTQWDTLLPVPIHVEVIRSPFENDQEMLRNIEKPEAVTENVTIQKMWQSSHTEIAEYLYIHTKGITSTDNLLRNGNAQRFKTYYYWRQYLIWGVIENWKECIAALETHNVAGVNFFQEPAPHFSGGFWWANTNYIKTLPDPSTKDWWYDLKKNTNDLWLSTCSDRFRDEMWICSKPARIFNLNHLPSKYSPAGTILPRSYYEN